MAEWKKFKIEEIKTNSSEVWFRLNDYVFSEFLSPRGGIIYFSNTFPFNTWQIGDWIEIDMEEIRRSKRWWIDDTNIVRKVGSPVAEVSSSSTGMVIGSTTITREQSLAVARELDAMVAQSGGRNEYTASIEVQDERGNPIKFSLSAKRSN